MACEERASPFTKGFKQRVAIKDSNRALWTGDNELADSIEHIANLKLGEMTRHGLVGENNLMLLEKEGVSIGIRNSGTQAKTNVSLRLAPGVEKSPMIELTEQIVASLKQALRP
jgi:hypothetical protein